MGKVICFYTRQEVTEPVHTKEQGEKVIEKLLEVQITDGANPFSPMAELVCNVMTIVENTTGANRLDVMERLQAKKA